MNTAAQISDQKIKEAIEFGEKLLAENGLQTQGFQEYWYNSQIKEWKKEDKHRLYVNLTYGRTYKGSRKWTRGVSYCIDLVTGTISDNSREYNNAAENQAVEQVAEQILNFIKQ